MKLYSIFERLTHRYISAYAHLDSRNYLCDVKTTPMKCTREPDDFDDGGNYVCYGRMPARLNK